MTATTKQICNRWGTPVTITGYCGKPQPKWAGVPLILVSVTYHDDDGTTRTGYQFVCNLRADGGWQTIDAAVDAAPVVTLSAKELKAAIKDAE